jgi:hypothetical protein
VLGVVVFVMHGQGSQQEQLCLRNLVHVCARLATALCHVLGCVEQHVCALLRCPPCLQPLCWAPCRGPWV